MAKRKYNKSIYYDLRVIQQRIFFTDPYKTPDEDIEHKKFIHYIMLLRDYTITYWVESAIIDNRDGTISHRKNVRVMQDDIDDFKKRYPELKGIMRTKEGE